MRFAKYQGIGNDFVMLADPEDRLRLTAGAVRRLCDRRFGVGADGVIRLAPGAGESDLFMDYVNSDGSVGEMCGNGIRCAALFARAEGMVSTDALRIDTRAGIKPVWIEGDGVRVDMGVPIFDPRDIPVAWEGTDALHAKIELDDQTLEAACVSMGNPHAVLFVDDPTTTDVRGVGSAIELHPMFPNRTNVEFMTIEGPSRVRMRVWERGSGETLACGTGAAAVAVVARTLGGAETDMIVELPGGELKLSWAGSVEDPQPVYMTGPAVQSFAGEIDLKELM